MTTKELHQRRAELSASLPQLTLTRDHAFQLKCDAEKLDRYGVTQHTVTEMARLADDHATAAAAVRALQIELRGIDNEITTASSGGVASRFGGVLRRR